MIQLDVTKLGNLEVQMGHDSWQRWERGQKAGSLRAVRCGVFLSVCRLPHATLLNVELKVEIVMLHCKPRNGFLSQELWPNQCFRQHAPSRLTMNANPQGGPSKAIMGITHDKPSWILQLCLSHHSAFCKHALPLGWWFPMASASCRV